MQRIRTSAGGGDSSVDPGGANAESRREQRRVRSVLASGRAAVAVVLGAIVLSTVSCATAPRAELPGESHPAEYSWGKLIKVFEAPLSTTYAATVATMRELALRKTSTDRDGFTAEFEYLDRDGTTIQVDLKKLSRRETEVTIGVGLLGDRKKSNLLLNEIKARLPIGQPEPASGWKEN